MSELHELAKEGRAKVGPRAKEPVEAAISETAKRPPLSRAHRAVTNAAPLGSIVAALALLLIASPTGALLGYLGGLPSNQVIMVGGFAGLLGVLAWVIVLRPLALSMELRWMERLPYALNVDTYLKALNKERERTRARVMLHFTTALPAAQRRLLRDAASGIHPDGRGEFEDDDTLTISADIRTHFQRRAGSDFSEHNPHSNDRVHRFVRTVLRDGVPAHPVKRVALQLSSC